MKVTKTLDGKLIINQLHTLFVAVIALIACYAAEWHPLIVTVLSTSVIYLLYLDLKIYRLHENLKQHIEEAASSMGKDRLIGEIENMMHRAMEAGDTSTFDWYERTLDYVQKLPNRGEAQEKAK